MATREKSGGRKKGTPNKRTVAKRAELAQLAESGMTPLEFMLQVLRDDSRPDDDRLDAARAAAPYVHPRLTATEITGAGGKDLVPDVEPRDLARAVLGILRTAKITNGPSRPDEADETGPEYKDACAPLSGGHSVSPATEQASILPVSSEPIEYDLAEHRSMKRAPRVISRRK